MTPSISPHIVKGARLVFLASKQKSSSSCRPITTAFWLARYPRDCDHQRIARHKKVARFSYAYARFIVSFIAWNANIHAPFGPAIVPMNARVLETLPRPCRSRSCYLLKQRQFVQRGLAEMAAPRRHIANQTMRSSVKS